MKLRILLVIALFLIPFLPGQVKAAPANPTIDTSNFVGGGSGLSAPITITTTQNNELLIYIAQVNSCQIFGTACVLSLSDNHGLTWINRGIVQTPVTTSIPGGDTFALYEYYALWPSHGSITITGSFNNSVNLVNSLFFGVVGQKPGTKPFFNMTSTDPHLSANATYNGAILNRGGKTSPPAAPGDIADTGVLDSSSTIPGTSMIIGSMTDNVGQQLGWIAGAGYTFVSQTACGPADLCSEYQVGQISTPTISMTIPQSDNTRGWGAIGDAILCNCPNAESQTVLFKDDFLGQTLYPTNRWTVDMYQTVASGVSQSSGYLIFKSNNVQTLQTVHFNTVSFTPGSVTDGTIVKRKLTAGLVPFQKADSNTANVKIGLGQLLTVGTYPGNTPSGSSFVDSSNNCSAQKNADTIGTEYMTIDNTGKVSVAQCGDGSGNTSVLATGLDPTLYTVFTVEPSAIYCTNCVDNAAPGSAWVWFRVYQEDKNGNVIGSSDKNANFTTGTTPLFGTSYVFVNQQATIFGVTSKIDIVQLQNFGSPVNLQVPLAIPFPSQTASSPGLLGLFADMARWIGNGNPQLGAGFLFMVWMGVFITPLAMATRKVFIVGVGGLLSISLFAYAGLIPTWVIVIMIFGTVILSALLFKMLVGDVGMSEGDASETLAGTGLE